MFKKFAALSLSVVLCVTSSFCALAAPASVSEWATPAELATSSTMRPSLIASIADDIDEVSNTVDLTDVQASVWFHGTDGTNFSKSVYLDSDGTFVIPDFQSDVGIDYAYRVEFYLHSGCLPDPGKYTMSFSFSSDTGGWSYSNAYFWSQQANTNVAIADASTKFSVFDQFSGGASGQMTVDMGRVSNASIQLNLPENSNNGFSLPLGGKFSLRFTKLSASSDTDAVTAGGAQTTDDIQMGISNTVNVISSSVDEITEQIAQLIQTIINQLDALWNQFAGEFTNMFAAWQTHTDAIVAAIQNIGTQASDGIQDIIDAGHNDADQIQENQDENADQIMNGYDNSQITGDNQELSDSLNQYDQAEDDLMDDVNGAINDVDFNLDLTSFSSVIQTVSQFLQACYENSGNFKIVINLSLLVSLASCVIGLYRFKGGG